MNLDLYTEEFRNFKFLKSSPSDVAYYRLKATEINRIQPGPTANNSEFAWPCRLEFVEQLLDLRRHSVYIVQPIAPSANSYGHDEVRIYSIENPVMMYGRPLVFPEKFSSIITEDNIQILTDCKDHYFICSETDREHRLAIKFDDTGLMPTVLSHVAVFYDKNWAEKYKVTLTEHLRKSRDAVSAITRLF